ncbi:hypothetical protein [Holmes Jungle virus]|uniref:Uncharacterized protein n=1 Tax=Holmes Jungle virus TaxID=2021721 RepID=A0A221LCG1_9RHAB|nr:hypothetical protein KM638_gp3 [Holmes Jungle virus]ASM90773.1 hypothetical protein [Holmes Jungle virus]
MEYQFLKKTSLVPQLDTVYVRDNYMLFEGNLALIWEDEINERELLLMLKEEIKQFPDYQKNSSIYKIGVGLLLSKSKYDFVWPDKSYLISGTTDIVNFPNIQRCPWDPTEDRVKIDTCGVWQNKRYNLSLNLHYSQADPRLGRPIWESWYSGINSRPPFMRFEIETVSDYLGFGELIHY